MAADILLSKNNDPRELVNLGCEFSSKGYLDMAMDFFVKAVSVDYTYPESYIEIGKLLYAHQRLDEAIRAWQAGLKYVPNDTRFRDLIAQSKKVMI